MNFEYTLSETKYGSLVIHIKPNPLIVGDYEPLEICLDSDVRDYDFILTKINEVINGNKLNDSYCGDGTYAQFDKDETVISYEESITSNSSKCTLPTWLFREIVEVWLKEAKKHFEERRKRNG